MDRNNIKRKLCKLENTSAINMQLSCTCHLPTIISFLLNKSHTKNLTLNKQCWIIFGGKNQENGPLAEK